MNLERLYIENYKQVRDPLELFPPEGAIGVVGANGAGKSTLFESILWAFFGSRGGGPRFANESIPWSGGSAKDPTVVEVTLTNETGSYTVRRGLKGSATTAEVREGSGKTLVTGASDVTRWAEENLLHMDRTAFEATFFARQKELRFFANDEGIGRVRRISKLLGIGGVEVAQNLLRADRNELRAEARVIETSLEEADLTGLQRELEEAREACSRVEKELDGVSAEYETAEAELASARERRAVLDAAHREHARLAAELRDAESRGASATERAKAAEKELQSLAAAEEELARIAPATARRPEVAARLERLEEDGRRMQQRERDRRECRLDQVRLNTIESEVYDLLEGLDAGDPVPGLRELGDREGADLLNGALSVMSDAAQDHVLAEARHEELRELAADHEAYRLADEDVSGARARLEEARGEEREVAEEMEDFSVGEDLEVTEAGLREEEEKLRELAALHRGRAAGAEREAKNVDRAREAIESGREDHCPTCHRGFDEGEQDEISDTLKRQAASLRRQATRELEEEAKLSSSAAAAAEKRRRVSEKMGRWRELGERRRRASDRASDRAETLERLVEHLAGLEASISGTQPPTSEDIEAAARRRERSRTLRDALPRVESLAREHAERSERVARLTAALEETAGLRYDEDAHAAARAERERLDRLAGRAEELDRRVATRPDVEASLAEAEAKAEDEAARAEALRGELAELAFDEAAYEAAAQRSASAEERERALRDAREALGGDWKDADHRTERAASELKRLDAERKRAGEKARGAARMDEMDTLFTDFFRSLTARARPMLEAEASALVRDLTDGRYDRMEFDENYRVRLLDRFDDSYAIERFSGGEADVASLSARVALSRLIAARGGGTLGFLVLDEVFGSLDAERRSNVLLALERLKRSFGQIFIISHVGDVQESALLDELWLVEEDVEGKSSVRRMQPNLAVDLVTASPDPTA